MANNSNMIKARIVKNDEFYTKMINIQEELQHYKDQFKGLIVYCNCDNPEISNFWKYFEDNFYDLQLKKLISTHYEESKQSYKLELELIDGKLTTTKTNLQQNGDFRSHECVDILKSADIVVTNPPFSLFKEYVAQLITYDKKFLIIGNFIAITHKDIFPLIKDEKIWFGVSPRSMKFILPDNTEKSVNAVWYTNLHHSNRNIVLDLTSTYSPDTYLKYDNINAINVERTEDIPKDYYGLMGVPITAIRKISLHQFDIIGISNRWGIKEIDGWKSYKNCMNILDDNTFKKSSDANACACFLVKDIVNNPKYYKYIHKRRYRVDNADGDIIANFTRLIIKRKR